MLKKFGILAASLLMSTTAAFADGQDMVSTEQHHLSGGFTTGLNTSTLAGAGVNVGYYGSCWLVDVSANYNHIHDFNFTNVVGHLGLRNRLYHNLFISYGAMGLGRFIDSERGWAVGAFTGLDYQISKHFMISGKTYPYNYQHSKVNQVFANGTISFLYVY